MLFKLLNIICSNCVLCLQVMQQTGIDGKEVIFVLEDYQFIDPVFLELVNSLLSAGEIPGLYTTEELEPLLTPLRDLMAQEGLRESLLSFFAARVLANLHVVLIMDSSAHTFTAYCQANPAFYTNCAFQSMQGWSKQSMLRLPETFLKGHSLHKPVDTLSQPVSAGDDLGKAFVHIHDSCSQYGATSRKYMVFLKTYKRVYQSRKECIQKKQSHLQAGLSKLNEATTLVDHLKQKAATQRTLLADKQTQADAALKEITSSMELATEQKNEAEILKQQQSEERLKLEKRKKAIDIELSEIEPLVQEARKAVGSIKTETLSEVRALRAPPDTIRDILEGVLRIMGVFDTSWASMRSFLAQRGVKEDIQTFDARKISPEIRESVQELLQKNKRSFDPKVAKKASIAAAPLASWVVANIRFSYVLEKIGPLEKEQTGLQHNLDKSEKKLEKLGKALAVLDQNVKDMRNRFELLTTEAAKLKIELEKEEETIVIAENLVGKLEGEHKRWSDQISQLDEELEQLPHRALLAAGFISYLSQAPEDERRLMLSNWLAFVGLTSFDLRQFLSSESEQLVWKSEGLPSDDLSMENAVVILKAEQCPFLIDPSQRATEWLKVHLKESRLEVINQQDTNFSTALELAVRFGKTLIIQEVDKIEPLLYPLLKKDLISQGPRFVIQLGDKLIDYNESFRLFLTTRNPLPDIAPDAEGVIVKVNFTTTRAGLAAQLLTATINNEKPQLETRKTELLKTEENLKVQLADLENSLLQELATAEGNILDNKVLLESLNQTKSKSLTITESLSESVLLQTSLDQERDSFLPLAMFGSTLYFVICDLCKQNNMYRFSLASFLKLFKRAFQNKQDAGNVELRIRALKTTVQGLVYEYVCCSLFKMDRLMFALHMVHGVHPTLFQDNEWEAFIGHFVGQSAALRRQESYRESTPSWADSERGPMLSMLQTNFPTLYNTLELKNFETWSKFARSSQCEKEFPPNVLKKITPFQQLLVIQALRPDRLQSAMEQFALRSLGLKELSPSTLNFKRLFSTNTVATEPILVIISPGADPSQEIQELAETVVGMEHFHELAMGQGQALIALKLLHNCAANGEWLCLKNLHLVVSWLPTLEKELNTLEPDTDFRLWLTTESHPMFPTVLLQSSLKVTYEAPPGIKKNLERTYDSWDQDYIAGQGNSVVRAQALFALAWFHAVVQERRCFIPQGWSKFYEFSLSDLRTAASVIDRLCSGKHGTIGIHTYIYVHAHTHIVTFSPHPRSAPVGIYAWSNGECCVRWSSR